MNDPFANLPLNTDRNYVMATAKSGCEVYIPVHSNDHGDQIKARDRLQAYLDTQPAPPVPETPEPEPKRYA